MLAHNIHMRALQVTGGVVLVGITLFSLFHVWLWSFSVMYRLAFYFGYLP